MKVFNRPTVVPLLLALLILLLVYLGTLQTIPNGAEHYYMIDVGETQIVLNTWGTLHATGYPLYVMVGNVLVAGLRLVGVGAAAAPGVTSLIYGLIALGLLYALVAHLTRQRWMSAAVVILFGLTRTVWIHNAIAEIYSFGLMILALLLLIALWQQPIRGRVYWLAFIGGIAVFHHRALLMAVPALLYAVWGELTISPGVVGVRHASSQFNIRRIVTCLTLGLLGFLPYAYLPLRAQAGAQWVYGQPNSWDGFWDQFLGREASRFIGAPATADGLLANVNLINHVLMTDLTALGIALGLLGLLLALRNPARRRVALTMLLSGGVAYGFHVLLYTDVLSALILSITLSLAFGWLLLAEWVMGIRIESQSDHELRTHPKAKIEPPRRQARQDQEFEPQRHGGRRDQTEIGVFQSRHREKAEWLRQSGIVIIIVIGAVILIAQNWAFIHDLTTNRIGLETIELAKGVPLGSTLMLDWGPRHFAVGFARDVLGELPGITLVDHKADFKTLIGQGELVTADFTFYNRPLSWWEQQLGARVYLRASAPHLVKIAVQPEMMSNQLTSAGIQMIEAARLDCTADALNLHVAWVSGSQPDHDLSVFVHLLDGSGIVIAQADQSAPVYGWRPLTSWVAGEVVRDVYPLPRLPGTDRIQYGLYRQLASGEFVNEYEYEIAVKCGE